MEIKPYRPEDAKIWDEFCLKSDDAWFWHTINYMDFALWYKPSANPVNKSFFIKNGEEILAIFPLIRQTINDKNIFLYGCNPTPQPCFRNSDTDDFKNKLLSIGLAEIDRIAKEEDCKELLMEITPLSKSRLLKLKYNYLLDFDFLITDTVTKIVTLSTFEEIKKNARKTYRHILQNYADKVRFSIYDQSNITREIFLKYKELHHLDAGRKTRPDENFWIMHDAIKDGNAFLAEVSNLAGEAIGYGLFYVYKNYALYGSAATHPSVDLPIGHLVQWNALQHLCSKNIELYDTSNQFPSFQLLQDFDEKRKQISFFKRGFGGELHQVFRGRKIYDKSYLQEELRKQLGF
ncbi:MAG TPA: hypothetical protein VJH68_00665 [Candidatus Nanoarchaeia archaeon]|nr:hypothetical protein [Candidatus Nanoarchaeia archaeon]